MTAPPLLLHPAAAKKFVLVAVNTRPERTVEEIDRLEDVFKEVSKKFNTQVSRTVG